MKVYRIEVTSWPTPDGAPWARLYGPIYYDAPEVPEWLHARVCTSTDWRVTTRVNYDDRGQFGVVMPKPKRVNYLSASGVSELAANMRAFGAEVVIHESQPVQWGDSA